MSLPRTFAAICVLLLAFVRVAHAEDATERTAKRHYDRGQKLFALRKFDDALEQFQKAFDAKPIPEILFNIAQCHRNLDDYDAAIFTFRRYLKLLPEAENRDQVEELISELEEKKTAADTERLRLGKRTRDREPDDLKPVEGESPVYKKWWFWTGVSVVAVGAGVGIYVATRPGAGGAPGTDLGNIDYPK